MGLESVPWACNPGHRPQAAPSLLAFCSRVPALHRGPDVIRKCHTRRQQGSKQEPSYLIPAPLLNCPHQPLPTATSASHLLGTARWEDGEASTWDTLSVEQQDHSEEHGFWKYPGTEPQRKRTPDLKNRVAPWLVYVTAFKT